MNKLVVEQEIYTYQIDFAGHVSNIVYIQWMEIGRLKLLEAVGLPVTRSIEEFGLLPTLINTEIRYHKQLFLGDRVRMEVWLSKLKKVSAVMEFRFYDGNGELVAEGRQTGLFIDKETYRPTPLETRLHDEFNRFLIEPKRP